MDDDYLIDRLESLCKRFSELAVDGRHTVANKAGLSEQYLYQIIARKPMANGGRRSVGKVAREKITKAFPDWLIDDKKTPQIKQVNEPAASYVLHGHHSRKLVGQLCVLAEQIDDHGLRGLIEVAQCFTKTHPLTKAKLKSSA